MTWLALLVQWLPAPLKVLHFLDFFHAPHRVWDVAHAMRGQHSAAAAAWAHEQCARIEGGQTQLVIDGLRFVKSGNADTQKMVDALSGYFTNNLKRMAYPAYRARGLRTTSGKVESASYHVTGRASRARSGLWSETPCRTLSSGRSVLPSARPRRANRTPAGVRCFTVHAKQA